MSWWFKYSQKLYPTKRCIIKSGYHRKKQPEKVKAELLKAASELGVTKGLSSITVQAVADLAGVTKGGLLHHFHSKQDLVEGVFNHSLDHLDAEIDRLIAADKETYGCFTRAYVNTTFIDSSDSKNPWPALAVSVVAEPKLRLLWYKWFKARLKKHIKTDSDQKLEIVRLAADGAWLNQIDGPEHAAGILNTGIKEKLLKMTKEK